MKTSFALLAALTLGAHSQTFFIGTGSGGGSKGIYAAEFDAGAGKLSNVRLAAEAQGPGFLALHPRLSKLYAVSQDTVIAYELGAGGKLSLINELPVLGKNPCHLAVNPAGDGLATANYSDGSISTFALDGKGALVGPAKVTRNTGSSVNPRRQEGPHAHGTHFLGEHLFVPDLGLDKVLTYRFDPESGLTPAEPPFATTQPGDGPRHLAFHPNRKHLAVIHELSNVAEVFKIDGAELTSTSRVSTLPDGFEGNNSTAEIEFHPNGRWLFSSNRGHNSIAVFEFDSESGKITRKDVVPCGARVPRHFALTPDGRWLLAAGQDSNDIHVMSFDPETGDLKLTEEKIEVPSPICILFPTESG